MRRIGSVVVWWLMAAVAHAGEMPKGYGKPVNGLASRLVSAGAVYEEGQSVVLHLDVLNVSDTAIDVAGGSAIEGRVRLTDDKDQPLQPRKQTSEGNPFIRTLSPGKQVEMTSLCVSGNEYAMYDPLKPGRYRAIWASQGDETVRGRKFDGHRDMWVTGHVPPESNVVVFEVVPPRPELVVPGSDVTDVPWGEAKGGLQTRVTAPRNKFYAGGPVPMKVEMRNVGKQTLYYHEALTGIGVRDSQGKPVRVLTGGHQTVNQLVPIKPGETAILNESDLGYVFLLKPGKYTAYCSGCKALRASLGALPGMERPQGSDIPAANTFSFEIVPSAEKNSFGDALVTLEERCPKDWALEHGRDLWLATSQPGAQWSRVPNSSYQFSRHSRCACGPTTTKGPMHTVTVWLARERAVEEPWQIYERVRPSEYVCQTPFGHLYVEAGDPNLSKHWPTAKSDIAQWLKAK